MGLCLSVISYQQLSPSLQANFTLAGASAVIGRASSSDWVLPDSDKILSSRHAELTLVMDKYYITDVSTNGVFINQSTKPLGKGNRHALTAGEQIILGEYVIEVTIDPDSTDANPHSANLNADQPAPGFPVFTSSPLTNRDTDINTPSVNTVSISDPFLAGSEMADSLVLDSHLIPDNWNWEHEGLNSDPQQASTKPHIDAEIVVAKSVADAVTSHSPTQAIAIPKPAVKPVKASVANTDNMMALLKGLGIDKSPVDGDDEWWFDLGASMRTINEELMSSLRERAAFKNKFRVNHTMFQIKENNPFKFSASVDDLFRNLYLRSNGSFMSTNKAITEAFGDLRQHEQSMRAGLEGAVVGILDQLAPENMQEEQSGQGFLAKFKRSNKELKQWHNYIEMHEDICNEITVNRESILSDAFVRAYEDKQKQG